MTQHAVASPNPAGTHPGMRALGWLVALLALAAATPAIAQKAKELPEPKVIEMLTKDGVKLYATYFASDLERDAVPLILLHMYKGSRADFQGLANYLHQQSHHAVLTLDLRGHGDSTRQTFRGEERTLTPDRLKNEEFAAMVRYDIEEAKRFLMREHNAGQVNIERLGLVGAEMGAIMASYWALNDWAAPRLAIKQGQDVKALVLISPETRFKAFSLTQPYGSFDLRSKVALHLIAGADNSKATRAAEQLFNTVKRYHPEPDDSLPADKALAEKTLFLDIGYNTSLQGTKMLGERLGVEERIAKFIELRLVAPSYPWVERPSAIP